MLLAVDVGNTNITIGNMDDSGNVSFVSRISTVRTKTEDEYAVEFFSLLRINGVDISLISAAIVSSVVPPLSSVIASALKKVTGIAPMIVGKGLKTGLNILIDNPAQLGADMVVSAVAIINEYALPALVFDMGTATTVSYIDENAGFRGVAIMPGVLISYDALVARTSLLQRISFEAPPKILGTNTADSMQSGVIYSNAAMMDGMCDRIEEEVGKCATILATGGLSKFIVSHCKRAIIYDENLMLKGLYLIYQKNKKE